MNRKLTGLGLIPMDLIGQHGNAAAQTSPAPGVPHAVEGDAGKTGQDSTENADCSCSVTNSEIGEVIGSPTIAVAEPPRSLPDPPSLAIEVAIAASAGSPDILREFALSANYNDAMAGVQKHLVAVSVTKPKRTWWFMAHSEYVLQAGIYVDEATSGREHYLVAPGLVAELGDDITRVTLYGAMTRQGVPFVIPVRLPGPDGRIDTWNATMREAVLRAQTEPVRAASNRDAGCYDIYTAPKGVEFPAWPHESWSEIVSIAFKDKTISSIDHPVLRRLRGEV